jgi:hypothetical protein
MSSTDTTTLAPCAWPLDEHGYARISDLRGDAPPCVLPEGLRGWVAQERLVDEYGHEVDVDGVDYRCQHRDTPEWKAAHRKHWSKRDVAKEQHMADTKDVYLPTNVEAMGPPAPLVTTASVAVPHDAPPDLMALLPKDGSASLVTVLLALIVMAGAIAWKFGPVWMEARREREAKQAELEEKKLDQQSSQHADCRVARDELAFKVASLEAQASNLATRVEELAGKVQEQASLAVGGDDVAKRVAKLEKALKALTKAPSAPKKGKS